MSEHRKKPRYPKLVAFRAPEVVTAAVAQAADERLTSASEYVRQAVLASLRADGFALSASKRA